jgi:uncharacterized protein
MAINTTELNDLIRDFVTNTNHVQGAALVTAEGLPIAGTLPKGLEESRAAAMAAAVVTIGDRIGHELQRGAVKQILLEGSQGYSILTLCGSETLFLVLASADIKQGIIMLEIRRIVAEIAMLI